MKHQLKIFLLSSILLLSLSSCKFDVSDTEGEIATEDLSITLSIPEGFDFSTSQEVTINIIDNGNYAKYDVYAYTDELYDAGTETFQNESGEIVTETVYKSDVMDNLIFSGVPSKGILNQTINIPKYYNKLYIRRNENLKFSSSISSIVNNEVNFTYSSPNTAGKSSALTTVTDYLYCVNESGQLFQVDPLSGKLTDLSKMPMGSYTCAINQEKKELYSIGKSSPYPLMKYSIETNIWKTIANLKIGGPRLDYNPKDGLLYFSNKDKLYTINPSTGAMLGEWDIKFLDNVNGGDLAFSEDGTLYMSTFSGLYKLEVQNKNKYHSTKISADNLPFSPTAITFDSNKELWLANSSNSSDLIIIDTQTGAWKYKYGQNAKNNTSIDRTIDDLTTFRVYSDIVVEKDTDGDGIIDLDDAFPEDAEIAFEYFTPSKYGKGAIAFEDLWPSAGDYDFNDAALNYQTIVYLNSKNLAVGMDFVCNIQNIGAGYTNGIGFEIEGLTPSEIKSVSGTVYTENLINLNSNGTEAKQENAVIILSDNVKNLLTEKTITIKFSKPINTSKLGVSPFNPFLIVNQVREKEIHLPYMSTTSLGSKSTSFNGGNEDVDGNYISKKGFPWAISIIYDFKVPKERVNITSAYNFFKDWANSGGVNNQDWYKDNPGNRNKDKIKD